MSSYLDIPSDNMDEEKDLLFDVCNIGDTARVENILRQYTDINYNEGLYGACCGGQSETAVMLLRVCIELGFTINSNWGLYGACFRGYKELAELMIREYGANDYNMGCHYACIGGHIELVRMMINYGRIDLDERLNDALGGNYEDIAKLLIQRGAKRT